MAVGERAASLTKRSLKKASKVRGLNLAISGIALTTPGRDTGDAAFVSVIVAHAIEQAVRDGAKTFDFLAEAKTRRLQARLGRDGWAEQTAASDPRLTDLELEDVADALSDRIVADGIRDLLARSSQLQLRERCFAAEAAAQDVARHRELRIGDFRQLGEIAEELGERPQLERHREFAYVGDCRRVSRSSNQCRVLIVESGLAHHGKRIATVLPCHAFGIVNVNTAPPPGAFLAHTAPPCASMMPGTIARQLPRIVGGGRSSERR